MITDLRFVEREEVVDNLGFSASNNTPLSGDIINIPHTRIHKILQFHDGQKWVDVPLVKEDK